MAISLRLRPGFWKLGGVDQGRRALLRGRQRTPADQQAGHCISFIRDWRRHRQGDLHHGEEVPGGAQ